MRTLSTFTIAVVLTTCAPRMQAQSWSPTGAQWWFEHWAQFGNQLGSVHVQYVADTLVQGVIAQRLSSTASGYDFLLDQPYQIALPNIITRSMEGQVSRWNGSGWEILFDLGVPVGGNWALVGENFADRNVTVLTTGTVTVQGVPLAYSTVSFDPPFSGIATDSIIERIGYRQLYLEPSRTVAQDGDVFGLRCYSDPAFSFTTTGGLACDFILDVPATIVTPGFDLYPNPSDGLVHIIGPQYAQSSILMLHDALGHLVARYMVPSDGLLDLSLLEPGVYSCAFMTPNGQHFGVGMWVKR